MSGSLFQLRPSCVQLCHIYRVSATINRQAQSRFPNSLILFKWCNSTQTLRSCCAYSYVTWTLGASFPCPLACLLKKASPSRLYIGQRWISTHGSVMQKLSLYHNIIVIVTKTCPMCNLLNCTTSWENDSRMPFLLTQIIYMTWKCGKCDL